MLKPTPHAAEKEEKVDEWEEEEDEITYESPRLTEEEEKDFEESLEALKKGDYKTFDNADALIRYIEEKYDSDKD